MLLNSPKRPSYWNSTYGFDFDHITAVDMSFCTSLRNFIQIGPPSAEKMTSCRFSRWRISAILDFMDPITGSLKSPCTTSYRSSIDTITLNCLAFEKIAFFCILATDRQTNKQTDKQMDKQMDSIGALCRSRCRERRLNNYTGRQQSLNRPTGRIHVDAVKSYKRYRYYYYYCVFLNSNIFSVVIAPHVHVGS